MRKIGLIDYRAGNLSSVRNALTFLELDFLQVREPTGLDRATHLILPGVGTFAAAMHRLETLRFVEALSDQVLRKGKPILGICVGMQVFADVGNEFESCPGLGFLRGSVNRIEVQAASLPIPHVGWNQLTLHGDSPLFAGITDSSTFYFLHSYQFNPADRSVILSSCDYGGPITACVQHQNIYGVQFHPEKSQRDGLRLLRNFGGI